MDETNLRNLSPLDGRYRDKTKESREIFSEESLINKRLTVELKWLKFFIKNFRKDLIKKSDVIIDNFKPGFWDKIGLSNNWFNKNVKNVVRTSISGYGVKGPQGGLPGYDFLMQAESGLMKITGETKGEPMKLGVAIVDIVTGLNAVISVLSGLLLNNKINNKILNNSAYRNGLRPSSRTGLSQPIRFPNHETPKI